MFGVSECPKGTTRQIHQNSDLNSVATIISSLNTDIKSDSISDCFHLGRFDPKRPQPRPLIVSLIHRSDIQTILANKNLYEVDSIGPTVFCLSSSYSESFWRTSFFLQEGQSFGMAD